MTNDDILKIHQDRFACKKFDPNSSISKEKLDLLLEVARLSPSSVGLEPWKFIVIEDKDMRQKLKPLCWDQSQITDASVLIAILSRTKYSLFEKGYIQNRYKNNPRKEFLINYIKSLKNVDEWTKKQCYIALANIMTTAKMLDIDSCAIEGFNSSQEVTKALGYDTMEYDLAVMVALGTPAMEKTPKNRLPKDEVVEVI